MPASAARILPVMTTKLTPEKKSAFLHVLAETCNVSKAAAAIGVARMTVYEWRDDDPVFAAAWDKAKALGVEALEDEAHRRAFEGVDKPVFYQGGECGAVREYSDTLAIFLLKAHNPEKYRENSKVEISGHLAVTEMSDDEIRAEIAALAGTGLLPIAGETDGSEFA